MKNRTRIISGSSILLFEIWLLIPLLTNDAWWSRDIMDYGSILIIAVLLFGIISIFRSQLHWVEKAIWSIASGLALIFTAFIGTMLLLERVGVILID
jgi:hypothetical protein